MARTQEQERAVAAWECIAGVKNKPFEKEYRSLAVGMTASIAMNGLAQAVAFWKSKCKAGNAHEMLSNHLEGWLQNHLKWPKKGILDKDTALKDSDSLKLATSEALAFGNWIKRFAAAELKKEESR